MAEARFDFSLFAPNPRTLFDRLRREVDESTLRAIANADYGCDAEKHYAALLTIHKSGEVPANLDWQPYEVLQLVRWMEPDDEASKPFADGTRGNVVRLFGTTILMRAAAEGGQFDTGDDDSDVVQAAASVQRLGPAYADEALTLFAWYGERARRSMHASFSAALGIASIWPLVSEPDRTRKAAKRLLETTASHPSFDDYLRRCFSLGRFELALKAAADRARKRSANGEISRKVVVRIEALARRIRDLTFPPGMPKPWD